MMVASALFPPEMIAGLMVRLISVGRFGGSMVRVEAAVAPAVFAEITTVREEFTLTVEAVNDAEI